MNKNLIELFRSNNQDDIRLAFLIAKQTNVPIEEVNLMFGLLPSASISESIAEEMTDYKIGDHDILYVDDKYVKDLPELECFTEKGRYYTYNFITVWKE